MKVSLRRRAIKPEAFDLFTWADQQRRIHVPLAARRLRQKFGLSPSTAVTTAQLAGFRMEGDR